MASSSSSACPNLNRCHRIFREKKVVLNGLSRSLRVFVFGGVCGGCAGVLKCWSCRKWWVYSFQQKHATIVIYIYIYIQIVSNRTCQYSSYIQILLLPLNNHSSFPNIYQRTKQTKFCQPRSCHSQSSLRPLTILGRFESSKAPIDPSFGKFILSGFWIFDTVLWQTTCWYVQPITLSWQFCWSFLDLPKSFAFWYIPFLLLISYS